MPLFHVFVAALIATSLPPASGARNVRGEGRSSGLVAYEAFLSKFGTGRSDDQVAPHVRAALHEQRVAFVEQHNAQRGKLWVAAVNKFADYSKDEFHALLGHRPAKRTRTSSRQQPASFVESPQLRVQLAASMDWRQKLNVSVGVKDQGNCGSCWAVAAAGSLEAHAELSGFSQPISYEQIVDCTPNPNECGGKGGCDGSTPELAFDYVRDHGLVAREEYQGYQSGGDPEGGECRATHRPLLSITGHVRLEENRLQPLLEAVATRGPVVVAADATDWNPYESGIFDGCAQDAVINHAILMMGYGRDAALKTDYFLVRNSWGEDWGEKGYLRLLRHSEDGYCGTDKEPLIGFGCKGGPSTVPVCGMCGILVDSSYPLGVSMVARSSVVA